jgi:hypothetical protein
MTTLLDPALDLSLAPLTNTPLASTDVTFEIADQATDIANFPDPGVLGYYAWVWAREPNFANVGDASRAGFAERVRVTARDLGLMTLTVTRDGVTPIDLNVSGVTYWLVAPMNAKYVDDIDERLFDFVGGNLVTAKTVEIDLLLADQIDMGVATPGVGLLRFLEDTANGVSAVTLQSPAALAGDVAVTLPSVLPGGLEFMQLSAAGLITTTPTVGVTLDEAYDQGGAGVGRIITADAGPVEINGQGLLIAPTSRIVWETSVSEFNFRTIAQSDKWEVQFGSQDADASNDIFNTGFVLSRGSGDNRIGLNTDTPSDLLHLIDGGSNPARIRLQTNVTAVDISIIFLEQTTSRWEIGYDDSAGGFVVGRLSFSNPAIWASDVDGRVAINRTSASGQLEIFSNVIGLTNTFINQDANGIGLLIDSEATSSPLISLSPLASTNTRGDIAFSINRLVDPSGPAAGDVWYNFLDRDALMLRSASTNRVIASRRYAFDTGPTSGLTLVGGLINPSVGVQTVIAEGGPGADDLDNITVSSAFLEGAVIILKAGAGDTITVRHNVGNIHLDGATNKILVNGNMFAIRLNGSSDWEQLTPMMVLL